MAAPEDPDGQDPDDQDEYQANAQILLNLAGLLEPTGRPDEARDLRRHAADRR